MSVPNTAHSSPPAPPSARQSMLSPRSTCSPLAAIMYGPGTNDRVRPPSALSPALGYEPDPCTAQTGQRGGGGARHQPQLVVLLLARFDILDGEKPMGREG